MTRLDEIPLDVPEPPSDFDTLASIAHEAIRLLMGELRLKLVDDAENGLWRHALTLQRQVKELEKRNEGHQKEATTRQTAGTEKHQGSAPRTD